MTIAQVWTQIGSTWGRISLVGRLCLLIIAAMTAGSLVAPARAQEPTVRLDLNPAEAADVLAKRKAADKAVPAPPTMKDISAGTREEMEKWGVLGAGVGKAMIAAAKELGMAANEFADTGLGKIVIVILVMKLFWKTLVGMAFAVVAGCIGFRIAYYIVWPRSIPVEYAQVPIFWGALTVRRPVKFETTPYPKDEQAGRMFCGAIASMATLGAIAIGLFAV